VKSSHWPALPATTAAAASLRPVEAVPLDDFLDFLCSCFSAVSREEMRHALEQSAEDTDAALGMILHLAGEADEIDEAMVDEDSVPKLGESEKKLFTLVEMFPEKERAELERVLKDKDHDIDDAVDYLTGNYQVPPSLFLGPYRPLHIELIIILFMCVRKRTLILRKCWKLSAQCFPRWSVMSCQVTWSLKEILTGLWTSCRPSSRQARV